MADNDNERAPMPEEVEEFMIKCYNSFVKQVRDVLVPANEKSVRRRLKLEDHGYSTISYMYLGSRFFKPRIEIRLIVRSHEMNNDCSCFVCNRHANSEISKLRTEYIFQIYFQGEIGEGNVYYDDVYVPFELTSHLCNVYEKLNDADLMENVIAFFRTNYPFNRCINCKHHFAKVGKLCYACDAIAIQYNMNGDKCSICLDTDIKLVCCILPCKHIFHKICYDKHAAINSRNSITACPMCKAKNGTYSIY